LNISAKYRQNWYL